MKLEEIKTLQPYNFREFPPGMKEKAEKMIADISPIGEVNEGTVDAVEAWSREDVLVLMRAMYNEALRQPRPIPSDVQEAAKAYEDSLDYHECMSQWPSVGYAAGMLAERERMMKEAMLTPEDIGTIFNLVREAQVNYNATEGCYPEVLKRFNEIKFKK